MVQWTPEKDQTLLKGVFQFADIKMSKELLEHLASLIGDGCTPKAIQHRLTNIKNTGKPVRDLNATPTKPSPAKEKAVRSTPSKTPSSARGRGRPKKNADTAGEPTNDLDGSLSPSTGRKRGRTTEATDGVTNGKKVKKEEIEENIFQDAADQAVEEADDAQDEI
ncbi:uncharacterized protein N0V89_005832 [Didymosphaeria variabile]|uniref:Uncharacterized protein n=1 Tax=Didymosphaeria variabile TaxID=1932322 RepID=A0A9W9CBV2_9PLEO|nr:uncharacterized protein N0V89_005832 [Didymosphaeria variabile]KAJ4354099.1 hypothetical protein N0V89_005832 [Didymosphaeria variabile]